MASKRIWSVAAVAVLVAVAGCSSGHSGSGAKPDFRTPAGKALTITPDQMLAATEGDTPVAYAKPEHGTIAYGANGTMIYTPDAGFTGTDQLHLTSTPASSSTPRTCHRSPPSAASRSRPMRMVRRSPRSPAARMRFTA